MAIKTVYVYVLMLTALGCPELEKPRYGWLVRERSDMAVLGCNESSVFWRLTCNDNRWTGPTVNCSPPGIHKTQVFKSFIAEVFRSEERLSAIYF